MSPATSDLDDRELVRRVAKDRDEQAFRALYRRHTPYLYQFALRALGGSETEAEDVVQETWIRGTERLGDFRGDASLRSWLVAIAVNVCHGLFRRKDRRWLELSADPEDPSPGLGPETRIDLEQALARLPAGYRAVLLLHDLEGYRHEDIARELGTSVGTSKSQLSRARRALRRLLGAATWSEA